MKSVHIISHCWCPPGYDFYSQLLKHQIASLIRYTSSIIKVKLTVCCDLNDTPTIQVFKSCMQLNDKENVELRLHPLTEDKLFRRAIGRNEVAKKSQCDVVWFCDCDYLFGIDCLLSVVTQVVECDTLYYPSTCLTNSTHGELEPIVESGRRTELPEIDYPAFIPKRIPRAIGGVQIVSGNTARRLGYLDGTKWMNPVDPKDGFRNTKCDISFRETIPGRNVSIRAVELYRLRHEVSGLFLDGAGNPK